MYASSESVLACFPNPNRTVKQDSSRLLTEKSISNLIKMLTKETGGFVISFNNEEPNNDYVIKFVLDGYYFEVNMGAVLIGMGFEESGDVYAVVQYAGGKIGGDADGYKELKYSGDGEITTFTDVPRAPLSVTVGGSSITYMEYTTTKQEGQEDNTFFCPFEPEVAYVNGSESLMELTQLDVGWNVTLNDYVEEGQDVVFKRGYTYNSGNKTVTFYTAPASGTNNVVITVRDAVENAKFYGVSFVDEMPTEGSYLHLLKKSDETGNWGIAPGSIYRFDENSISYNFGTFPQNN